VATLALGTWGSLELPFKPSHQNIGQSLYRAAKLYALDLGNAGGGNESPSPNPQLWIASLLAAALVLRAALGLWRNRLRRYATGHWLSGHVVICGAGTHGSRLAEALADKHDVVVVDQLSTARGMLAPPGRYEWRIEGDAVETQTLLAAGAHRANWVIATTGDDYVNSQIASTMCALAFDGRARDGAELLVAIDDSSLARFLERAVDTAGAVPTASAATPELFVSPFSPNAIAAETLLDESDALHPTDGLVDLLRMRRTASGAPTAPNLLVAGDDSLLDALLLACLRRWRVRVLRGFESNDTRRRPPLHVSVFGPGAVERIERFQARWHPEQDVLRLDARDCELDGPLSATHAEWLARPDRADHVIVSCREELAGVALTLELARAFGPRMLMTRVTADSTSVLDEHLERQTAANEQLARIAVCSIAELACRPDSMRRLGAQERLVRALAGRRSAARDDATGRAAALFENAEQLRLSSDSNWRIRDSERPLIAALLAAQAPPHQQNRAVPLSALVHAGLRIELATATNMRAAAEVLSRDLAPAAFSAWCEFARRATTDQLGEALSTLHTASPLDPVRQLLSLKLAAGGAAEPTLPGIPQALLKDAQRIAVFAGAAGSISKSTEERLGSLLERALIGFDGVLTSGGTAVGVPGIVGRTAARHGLVSVGYVPAGHGDDELYTALRYTDATDFSILEPLLMWSETVQSGWRPEEVALLALPGGRITLEEVLLARVLGARVGWLDLDAAGPDIDDLMPTGAGGILQLPIDAMTVRAFLMPSRLEDDVLREQLAGSLHRAYRLRQRGRKPTGDPALASWDELLPHLRASNLAAADDIPNKLALVGKQLVKGGGELVLTDDQVSLLAEVEHGRWTFERLSAGWTEGQRHVLATTSPDMKPWSELDEATAGEDREAVASIGPALAMVGWGVTDAVS
jgi:voltage-gated potassium channel Kch